MQTRLTVERIRTATGNRLLIARKAKHRQRDWDRHVDTDLASFNFFLELAGRGAGAGEDGGTVAILVLVDEFDGFVQAVDVEADEDRAEDFFLVAAHVLLYVCDDCWADLYTNR